MNRGATQILYGFLPGALVEHDDYGMSRVEEVEVVPVEVNRRAVLNLLADHMARWERDDLLLHQGYFDPRHQGDRFIVGRPGRVRLEPFPSSFACPACGYTAKLARLRRLGGTPGACPKCNSTLSRLTVVQLHNCGLLEELSFPDEYDQRYRGRDLRLFNPGRTRDARWHIHGSGEYIGGLRMWPCNCAYTQANPLESRFKRQVEAKEPTTHLSHVLPFLNFDQQQEDLMVRLERASGGLLLAKLWGLLPGRVRDALARSSVSPAEEEMLAALRSVAPGKAREMEERLFANPAEQALKEVARLGGETANSRSPSRALVEHAILEDTSDLTTAEMVAARRGGAGGLEPEYLQDVRRAVSLTRLKETRLISDFRIALAAVGFTRVSRDPRRSILRAFPQIEGRVPIYCVPNETEALWFQLDPEQVLRWLVRNGAAPREARGAEAWAELWRLGLFGSSFSAPEDRAATLVYTLLHTLSHTMIQRIVWSGFAPESIGEYLLPDALGLILYANRYADTKIGGLTTLFEQQLPYWLSEVYQDGRNCIYDPLCGEDGGSCVGCTQLEHNCVHFNRYLSRLALYGGSHPELGRLVGYWEP